jgi:Flp pilus assembly protein TadB
MPKVRERAQVQFLKEQLCRLEEDYLSYTYLWTRLLMAWLRLANPFNWDWSTAGSRLWESLKTATVSIFTFWATVVVLLLALPVIWALVLVFPVSVSVGALIALIRNKRRYKKIKSELAEMEASLDGGTK